jgi:hypothetical protein
MDVSVVSLHLPVRALPPHAGEYGAHARATSEAGEADAADGGRRRERSAAEETTRGEDDVAAEDDYGGVGDGVAH